MYKPVLYLSKSFLDSFIGQMGYTLHELLTDNKYELYANLYKLLYGGSRVTLAIKHEDFVAESKSNPYLNKLLKDGCLAHSDDFDEQLADPSKIDSFSGSVLLLDKDAGYCNNIEKNYGIICKNWDSVAELQSYFEWQVVPFKKSKPDSVFDWNSLQTYYQHPHDSLVIIDPYILAKPSGIYNLKQLLKLILPKEFERTYCLTIFFSIEKQDMEFYEKRFNMLRQFLDEDFSYKISLSVIKGDATIIHDRHLKTNYLWINSGYGFEVTDENNKASRNTQWISTYSLATKKNCQYQDVDILQEVKQLFARVSNNGVLKEYFGEKTNRLLE